MDWMEEICPNRNTEPEATPSTGQRKASVVPANRRSSRVVTPGRKATLQTPSLQSRRQSSAGRKATLTQEESLQSSRPPSGRKATLELSTAQSGEKSKGPVTRQQTRERSERSKAPVTRQKSGEPSNAKKPPREKSSRREKSGKRSGERKSKRQNSSESEKNLAGTSRSGLNNVPYENPSKELIFPGFESSRYTLSSSSTSGYSTMSSKHSSLHSIRESKVQASELKHSGFAMFDRHPGIIRNITVNPLNQRILLSGVDVFNGDAYESVYSPDETVSVPVVHRLEAAVINVKEDCKMVTIPFGNMSTRDVKCSNDYVLNDLKSEWRKAGIGDLWVEIMKAGGVERVIGFYNRPSTPSAD